mmetsp:Transcript_30885/g.106772  ORF Transcript_30885/g.106772 Transcript_30885/m.106772 type:complete len:243 (-) Transcript_30885:1062-1790(-)
MGARQVRRALRAAGGKSAQAARGAGGRARRVLPKSRLAGRDRPPSRPRRARAAAGDGAAGGRPPRCSSAAVCGAARFRRLPRALSRPDLGSGPRVPRRRAPQGQGRPRQGAVLERAQKVSNGFKIRRPHRGALALPRLDDALGGPNGRRPAAQDGGRRFLRGRGAQRGVWARGGPGPRGAKVRLEEGGRHGHPRCRRGRGGEDGGRRRRRAARARPRHHRRLADGARPSRRTRRARRRGGRL